MTQAPMQEIFGTESNDPILGTAQNDLIRGNAGNDIIVDNEGNDLSFGDRGNDTLFDGAGNDILRGGAGNDSAVGIDPNGGGDDFIDLGVGNDFAVGGAGADTFVLNRDSGVTLIADFTPGEDRFALGENLNREDLNFAELNNDSLFNGSSTLIRDAGTGELLAFASSVPAEALSYAEFVGIEDFPKGYSSTTEAETSEPIQVELPPAQSGEIFGTSNVDVLVGDDGTNAIYAGSDNDFINAGGGDDLVFGEDDLDILNGEAGNDLLNGGADGDGLNGGEGADTLLGETGFDVLNGDVGNDVLLGGSDDDVISGGENDDLLFGGSGNDALFGDGGKDTFAFALGEGADIIFDFELGQDAIALESGFSYDSLKIEYNAAGNYTTISDESGELVTALIGVEADLLSESDFVLT